MGYDLNIFWVQIAIPTVGSCGPYGRTEVIVYYGAVLKNAATKSLGGVVQSRRPKTEVLLLCS